MKTLFLSLSSSFVHTLLSPRYLAENSPLPVKIYETNVNIDIEKNLAYIEKENPDVLAFACYIFNIAYIKDLIKKVRVSLPNTKIVLGGYEAAFNEKELAPYYDFLIKGEGDFAFGELLQRMENGEFDIPKVLEVGTVKDLNKIKSPYTDEYLSFSKQNKILYMETCRGCPFSCSYCMSANTRGVRSFSLERIFSDFEKIMEYKPPLVKLVDRTFNFDMARAEKIISFLVDNYAFSGTRFHFEMAPELFNESLLAAIKRAPKGLFQFEIGVQSYYFPTLKAIDRRADVDRVDRNLKTLLSYRNVPVHVDLIAGLPHERIEDFKKGFDRLLSLLPDCLQLGFLKILKGSKISDERDGYVVENTPPYEIVSSPCMTENDLKELKKVEWALNTYYNSDRFHDSIRFLLGKTKSGFDTFLSLYGFFEKSGFEKKNLSSSRQCDLLFSYGESILDEENKNILERLIYDDFIRAGNVRRWHKWLSK
ncbi:MAG: DUF4080 domain-containing protein [Clostridia bacterium]|nr:DUF4080 domain-containing protein [Clostridia bacterium]